MLHFHVGELEDEEDEAVYEDLEALVGLSKRLIGMIHPKKLVIVLLCIGQPADLLFCRHVLVV